jgi:alkylation response protein AidB-like acyl-CoA dehydrogenase
MPIGKEWMMNQYEKWLGPTFNLFEGYVGQAGIDLLQKFDSLLTSIDAREQYFTPLVIRKEIARSGFALVDVDCKKGGMGFSTIVQGVLQFITGYHSLDYRDAAHVAHGRMIIEHGSTGQRNFWVNRLVTGELIGIAATEEQGGSAIQGIRTTAVPTGSGGYVLNGQKRWISRIKEASAFIVFFRFENSDHLSAALLPADISGMEFSEAKPSGLDGWSWGCINLNRVSFTDAEVLGGVGNGLAIFRDHFEYYRSMIAIAALGAAASVFDAVIEQTRLRLERGHIARCRDSALEQFGWHFNQIHSELLAAFYAVLLKQRNHPDVRLWSRASKAGAVMAAYQAVQELSLLYGASSFQYDHKIAKAERDLRGLLYADGIHNELLRSTGQLLLGELG